MKMEEHKNILSRLLPKTGQTYAAAVGDDGDLEAGWWKGLKIANNRTRFVVKGSGINAVVVDRATGLMWAADGNGGGCDFGAPAMWSEALDIANGLVFGGHTDWRIPNIKELMSIVDFGEITPSIDEVIFPNTQISNYWTSSSVKLYIEDAWCIEFAQGVTGMIVKSTECLFRCCRGGL